MEGVIDSRPPQSPFRSPVVSLLEDDSEDDGFALIKATSKVISPSLAGQVISLLDDEDNEDHQEDGKRDECGCTIRSKAAEATNLQDLNIKAEMESRAYRF